MTFMHFDTTTTSAGGETAQVTIGTAFFTQVFGYAPSAAYGSINPDPYTFNGLLVTVINSSDESGFEWDFQIGVNGTFASQDDFTKVVVEDGTGAFRTYTSASATFFTQSSQTFWVWGAGLDNVWLIGDVGEVRSVTVFV